MKVYDPMIPLGKSHISLAFVATVSMYTPLIHSKWDNESANSLALIFSKYKYIVRECACAAVYVHCNAAPQFFAHFGW